MSQNDKINRQDLGVGAKAFQEWLKDNKVVAVDTNKSYGEILVAVDKKTGRTIGHVNESTEPMWESALKAFLDDTEIERLRDRDINLDEPERADDLDDIEP